MTLWKDYILEPHDFDDVRGVRESWTNVYEIGYGFARVCREDAIRYASEHHKTLYRIHVKPKAPSHESL